MGHGRFAFSWGRGHKISFHLVHSKYDFREGAPEGHREFMGAQMNTNEYKYLGIIFKPSGSFTHAVKHLILKARKAIFSLRNVMPPNRISLYIPYHI